MSVITSAFDALKRVAAAIIRAVPGPPPSDAPAPDIDGRRESELGEAERLRVQLERKEGHGGVR